MFLTHVGVCGLGNTLTIVFLTHVGVCGLGNTLTIVCLSVYETFLVPEDNVDIYKRLAALLPFAVKHSVAFSLSVCNT